MKVTLAQGDITKQDVDAVVNAANSGLRGGGGVDGAIHRAAGPALAEACARIRREQGGCPTGQAVITAAGNMLARHVIHTVGPVWHGGTHGEPQLLHDCYANSLRLAEEQGLRTVAFPAISCGVYGYPIEQAARIAFEAVAAHDAASVEEARFVLFSARDYEVYAREHEHRAGQGAGGE